MDADKHFPSLEPEDSFQADIIESNTYAYQKLEKAPEF